MRNSKITQPHNTASIDTADHNLDLTDDVVFSAVAELAYPKVYRIVLRILHNEADAQETTQDIFLKAYNNRTQFDHRSSPLTWLYSIAVNQALQQWKYDNRRTKAHETSIQYPDENRGDRKIPTMVSEPRQHADLQKRELTQLIEKALGSVSEKYRQVLELYYVADLKVRDITLTLGLNEGAVKARLFRGREEIRKQHQARLQAMSTPERPFSLPALSIRCPKYD